MKDQPKLDYVSILNSLKEKIRAAKVRAAFSVNSELLTTYWEIGNTILQKQKEDGWGSKVIDNLCRDLKSEFPDMKGLSPRNFKYMRTFAETYPNFPDVQVPLAQIPGEVNTKDMGKIVQVSLAQLPWYSHITLLDKVKDPSIRIFYITKGIENRWTRDEMVHQIESGLHQRQAAITNNFKETIIGQDADFVRQIFKDPYYFDFLQLHEKAKERDLENALVYYITNFLLEMGDGFAFKGRQYRLEAGGNEYFLDLLFYHTKLRRHIVIDLKIGDFLPEFAGKMNFYLGLTDDTLKGEFDEPAIGLILCKTKNKIIAEYALRDTSKPIGIAEYKIAEILPDDIKGELPSIEELEHKLGEELKEKKNPLEERLSAIREKLGSIPTEEIQTPKTFSALQKIYQDGIRILFEEIIKTLYEFNSFFYESVFGWDGRNKSYVNFKQMDEVWNDEIQLKQNDEFRFWYNMLGFRKGGTDNFSVNMQLTLRLDTYWYGFALFNYNNGQPILKKLYHQLLNREDIKFITEKISTIVMDQIEYIISVIKDRK